MATKKISDEKIVIALITCGSRREAASFLRCSISTLCNRLKDPELQKLYSEAKTELLKEATAKLQNEMKCAVDTLADIMKNPQVASQTRVNAAVSILMYGARFTEQADILERLEKIEEAQSNTLHYKGI